MISSDGKRPGRRVVAVSRCHRLLGTKKYVNIFPKTKSKLEKDSDQIILAYFTEPRIPQRTGTWRISVHFPHCMHCTEYISALYVLSLYYKKCYINTLLQSLLINIYIYNIEYDSFAETHDDLVHVQTYNAVLLHLTSLYDLVQCSYFTSISKWFFSAFSITSVQIRISSILTRLAGYHVANKSLTAHPSIPSHGFWHFWSRDFVLVFFSTLKITV